MLVIIMNIPSPYRTAFFNVLKLELDLYHIGLHVLYSAKSEPRRFWKFEPEENIYDYTFLKGFHPKFRGFYPHFNYDVRKKICDLKPKWILMGGSWNSPANIQTLVFPPFPNAKTIFWSEGHFAAQKSNKKIVNKFRKSIYRMFDSFVVPNKKSADYVRYLTDSKSIGFLPNTVDEGFFCTKALSSKDNLRIKHGFSNTDKIILTVATVSCRKGSLELAEGFNLIPSQIRQNSYLIYIGTGELLINLKKYKSDNNLDNILILGQKEPREVREYLHLADYFILPTKLDPNPLTPIEASFMKKALILSIFAGNHDELITPKTGISISEITSEHISKVIEKALLKEPSEIIDMGESAYLNAINNFSRKSSAQNLVSFLKSI